MNKVNLASLFLFLLLIVGLCLALMPTSAKATHYIPGDEEIGTWDLTNTTYTLTQNVTEGIEIYADNFTLDGDGYTVTGDGWGTGVYLDERTDVTIKNLTVENFNTGIDLWNSTGNKLVDNTASNNSHTGICLVVSSYNILKGNTASYNIVYGIYLASSDNNTLQDNTVSENWMYGIVLDSSTTNTLTGNTASESGVYGIYLDFSTTNKLIGNTVSKNSFGISLESSAGNTIYNNYFNNTSNFYFDGNIYFNTWNTTKELGTNIVGGPNLGGNFWAKPDDTGFSQTTADTDGDGFCDEEYKLDSEENNVDNLPLALPRPQVVNVTLNPPSPVKAGSATFTITFSQDMNTGISPTVTFGRT
ncbi:hypothetical protein CEE34_10885, partial [Candidatus Aerophobetes bacterium Ae_b3a]